jgi:4-cresol dehydrogenase (hydroxylating)
MTDAFTTKLESQQFQGEIREDLSAEYAKNVSRFNRKIRTVVFPKSVKDIEKVILCANETQTSLYPVSRGQNWGFGSRAPVKSDSVIVDLRNLNRIREVNLEFGYAVIEPGVTQADLAQKLSDLKADYYLDVTGSGAETSIIGNALERGIAYSSLRVDNLSNLEVILGDGTLLQTGFNSLGPSPVNDLYSHGLGPGLHHLFFQSNFGIVISATIKLQKRKSAAMDFKLSFSDSDMATVFEKLRLLKQSGTLKSICRTGDFARSFETMAPLLNREYAKLGISLTEAQLRQKYRKYNPYEWTCFGRIDGEPEEIHFKKKQLQKHFGALGKLQFFTEASVARVTRMAKWFHQWDLYCSLRSSESLRLLSAGQPTNAALQMTSWNSTSSSKDVHSVDDGHFGFILVVPLCPLNGKHAAQMVAATREISKQYKVNLGITLNTISETVLEGVISLKFTEESEGHRCMHLLYQQFHQLGYWPYRLNIENMPQFIDPENSFWQVSKRIKTALDPNGIIAPGRYEITRE